jgi:predicted RNase H-like nuclease (RuvC/YqgF family)
MQEGYDKSVAKEFYIINQKLKASFAIIKNDLKIIDDQVRTIQEDLKDEVTQRERFRNDVDDFTQKTISLRLVLSEIRAIKNNVVLTRDLAKIEDSIKTSFKRDVEDHRERVKELKNQLREQKKRIKALEKGVVKKGKKKGFFAKKG